MKLDLFFQNIIDNFAIYGNKVAVAVSGGVDSIVLLHLIIDYTRKKNFSLPTALIVDHRLRPESQEEANFVSNYVKQLGVESFILNCERQSIVSNIQSQARKARYRLLTEWCTNNNIEYLFVAHHRDDQAETFLLRLERGSGIDGLSSMDYKSFSHGICILRPLLDFSRSDIEKYAKFYQLKWVEDRSNQNLKYKRALYRNLLNASDDQDTLTQRICLSALHMKRALQALMYYTRLAFDNCVNIHDLGYIEIKLNEFYKLPEEIALRVFLYSIMAIGNRRYKPRYNSLIFIFNKILYKDYDIDLTFSGCKIKKYGENILIIRESSKIEAVSINLPDNKPIQWDNRFSCAMLGGHKCQVTIAPLKKTQKIPESLRKYSCCPEVLYSLPVVQNDGKILAYPYMHHNTDNIA
ncbi:Rossmann-like alpha/beta/alpha sandwich fold,tRNA(Ile)-lysidine/2-thiocytidine synthase, N-, partial [Cinara cedri]